MDGTLCASLGVGLTGIGMRYLARKKKTDDRYIKRNRSRSQGMLTFGWDTEKRWRELLPGSINGVDEKGDGWEGKRLIGDFWRRCAGGVC